MGLIASYRILPDLNLVIQRLEGDVDLDTLKKFREKVMADKHYNPGYARLNDFRNASFLVDPDAIDNYATFEQNLSSELPSKIILLTQTPNQVAASILYSSYMESNNVLVLSTVETAIVHLTDSRENGLEIEKCLNQLTKEPVEF